ncbi:MAG: thioredoxin family protein [Spirochaetota bacterium]
MVIKILGKGCPKCNKLEENVKKALEAAGVSADIQKVTDINQIMDYGVAMTPALVIDEQVKSSGKVMSVEQVKKYIQ